ncbi:hypothetical protein CRENBAI_002671 [Crenichthys baileyi]|uniref:Uncharacterized protein n=1 Tax=Crenichthys baileyi TaxID=28760 RepID=A0AAV9SMI0_9TELE
MDRVRTVGFVQWGVMGPCRSLIGMRLGGTFLHGPQLEGPVWGNRPLCDASGVRPCPTPSTAGERAAHPCTMEGVSLRLAPATPAGPCPGLGSGAYALSTSLGCPTFSRGHCYCLKAPLASLALLCLPMPVWECTPKWVVNSI